MRDGRNTGAAERFRVDIGEGTLAGLRWPNAGRPPLLFCHATGFCASAYQQMLGLLAPRFDIFALDMRGHGRTALPAQARALRSWDDYARDVAAFLDRQDRPGWTLAGHSLGAVVSCLAVQGRERGREPGRGDVAALRLIEPVAMPSLVACVARTPFWRFLGPRAPLAGQAARRRRDWPSRAEVMAAYEGKALFRDWAPGVLADYLEDGLEETADGVRLACEPAWEAATFSALAHDFWGAARRAGGAVDVPVGVLAADDGSTTVRRGARARLRRLGIRVTPAAGLGHLAPMQDPARCARFIETGA